MSDATTQTEVTTTTPAKPKVKAPPKSKYGTGRLKSEKKAAKKAAAKPAAKAKAAPKTAKAAAKPAKAKSEASPRTRSDLPADSVIKWAGGENPAREGTGRHARWEILRKAAGKTVGQFLAAGGNGQTLRNAIKDGSASIK
jgi:hypothetical protein